MEISLGFTDPGLSTSFTVLTQIVNHAASGGMAAAKCGRRALFFQGEGSASGSASKPTPASAHASYE
jgi:hypothetical protein